MPNRKLPQIKKNVRAFLNSEEGKITKKSAFQLGLSIGIAGFLGGQITHVEANCWPASNHTSHSSSCNDCPFNHSSDYYGNNSNDNSGDNGGDYYGNNSNDGCSTDDSSANSNNNLENYTSVDEGYQSNFCNTIHGSDRTGADTFNNWAEGCNADDLNANTSVCPGDFSGNCPLNFESNAPCTEDYAFGG